VDTFRSLIAPDDAGKELLSIPVVKRELVSIGGISKQGKFADVDFTWKWVPLNEVGAAIYSGDLRYRSTVSFRIYDDGWRIVESSRHYGQNIDEALKSADPAP
jgi:hypothetical protein